MRLFLLTLIVSVLIACCFVTNFTFASMPDFIVYEGRLLDSNSQAITTTHTFRFSFWQSNDFITTDIDGTTGTINTSAINYSNWQEVQNVTPNSNGVFSAYIGSNTPLPDLDFQVHKYLQVEIKTTTDPDTAYQLMDPTGDNGADTRDRKSIGSLPYALNSEKAYSSKDSSFLLDPENIIENAGTGTIKLQFGNSLGKLLEYDFDNHYFNFNDNVNIQGDLTLSGLINGIDITSLTGGHAQNTDTGTSSDTFHINNDENGIILDTTGLTANQIITFNDADTIVVGENNVQTLSNKTIDGNNNTITNIDSSSLKDKNKTIILSPNYQGFVFNQDGSNNMVSLYEGKDNEQQYYILSSAETSVLQDLDLQITIQIPDDFVNWQTIPIQINIKSSTINATDNQLDITLKDSGNADVILTDGDDLVSSTADTWTVKDVTFSGTPTFIPGSVIKLNLKLQAYNSNKIYVGDVKLNYVGK